MTCSDCPECRATDGVKSDCKLATLPVFIRVGKCPLAYFDNSGAKAGKVSTHVYVCSGHQLRYTVAAWERIAACELVGTKYKVGRDVWEEIRKA